MTRDDIIRMAEECGIPEFENNESQADNILRFADLVAAAEREACASIIDDAIGATVVAKAEVDPESGEHIYDQYALEIVLSALSANAAAIRSRT
jgi:hypothetical protein